MTNQQKENLQKEYNKLEERHLIQKKEYQEEINELMNIIKTKEFETKAKKKEAEQKKKEKYEEAEKEARETGENVVMDRFSVECNDPSKECNTDIITVLMTPSGRTKEERTHTY